MPGAASGENTQPTIRPAVGLKAKTGIRISNSMLRPVRQTVDGSNLSSRTPDARRGSRRDGTNFMKHSRTSRGFEIVEFVDIYGVACNLQQSSFARNTKPGSSALWLGRQKNAVHPVTGEQLSPRMHLDRRLTKQLVARLQKWLKNGSFR